MVFNILSLNKDDHSKNFSFIYKNGKWKLSPAYDLVKSYGFNDQHTTTILTKGNPTKEDIFALANKMNLKPEKSLEIYEEVHKGVAELKEKYSL
jgi:serine/threonine-protein kinase HipA